MTSSPPSPAISSVPPSPKIRSGPGVPKMRSEAAVPTMSPGPGVGSLAQGPEIGVPPTPAKAKMNVLGSPLVGPVGVLGCPKEYTSASTAAMAARAAASVGAAP